MRDALTILAGLVVALLVAALAVPPLVDWRTQRVAIETVLSRALGAAVTTGGAIDIRLLPSPRLRLERMHLGGRGGEGAELDAAYLRAEIALAPLLGGEIRFLDARIGRAELRLPAGEGGGWSVPRPLLDAAREKRGWAFEDVSLLQLLVTRQDAATGRTDQLYAEGVELAAPALGGPWRASGRIAGQSATLSTGEIEPDGGIAFRLGASLAEAGRLTLEGRMRFEPETGDRLRPRLAGTAKLASVVPAPAPADGSGPLPANLSTGFESAGTGVELRDTAVEWGEGNGALRLAGKGRWDTERGRLDLELGARRVDLDALSAALQGRPAGLPVAWLGDPHPIVGLELKVDSVAAAGADFIGLAARIELDSGRLRLRSGAIAGPGGMALSASGEMGLAAGAGGTGHLDLKAASGERVGALLASLPGEGGTGAVAKLLAPGALAASADLAWGAPVLSFRNLQLVSGETRVLGAVRYNAAEAGSRARLDAQLALQGLDLQRLPPVAELAGAARGVDLGLVLDARNVSYGGRSGTGRITARLSSDGPALSLDRLDIADLAGADATASGRIEPDGTGTINGQVKARRGAPLFTLAAPAWLGGLAALVPASLRDGELDAGLTVTAASDGYRTALVGRLAGGPLRLETETAAGRLRRVQGEVATDRLSEWLPRDPAIGRAAAPRDASPARLTFAAARGADGRLGLDLSADLAGTMLHAEAPLRLGEGDDMVEAGRLVLSSADLAPLGALVGSGLALPTAPASLRIDLSRPDGSASAAFEGTVTGQDTHGRVAFRSGRIEGEVATSGLSLPGLLAALALPTERPRGAATPPPTSAVWPSARFGAVPSFAVEATLRFRVARLDLGTRPAAESASFDLVLGSDGLALRGASAGVAGGRLEGDLAVSRQGGLASLTGEIGATDLDLAALTGAAAGPTGRIGGRLRFGGAGQSLAEIVGNLGGGGTASFTGISVPRIDGSAVERTAARALRGDDPLASGRLLALAGTELDRGPLLVASMSGPATLTAGTIRVAPLRSDTTEAIWAGSVAVDLRALTLDARGSLTARSEPRGWVGAPPYLLAGLTGPLADPKRSLDVGPLTSGLAAAVLARELDRIDTFEADRVERARQKSRTDMDRDRQERERRGAIETAAAEKAAADKAAADRAAAERAAADRTKNEPPTPAGEAPPPAPPRASAAPEARPSPGG